MKKRSELFFSFIQIPVDYIMLVTGFVLAFLWRESSAKPFSTIVPGMTYLKLMLIFLPLWLLIFGAVGLYRLRANRQHWLDVGRIIAASAAGVMILIVIDFLSTQPIFPAKSVPIYGFIFATVLVIVGRLVLSLIQRIAARSGIGVYRILFIGSGANSVELKAAIKSQKSRYKIVQTIPSLRGVTLEKLESVLKEDLIDEVMVADSGREEEKLNLIMQFCQTHHLVYQFAPSLTGMYSTKVKALEIADIPVLELEPTPLDGWGRIIKRIFDVVVTLFITIISLPFQAAIAIIMKLTDPGPVIYKHECYGRNGKKFFLYKFRSMKAEYCTGPQFGGRTDEEILKKFGAEQVAEFKRRAKLDDDPRVSKIGKFTRKTSLDELPQVFNILKGELSLVGPRPLPESEVELVGGEYKLARILTIRPGLTGLWQVSGRNDLEYSERVKLNIFYLENWSLWLDISILWKTFWQVITKRNGR